MVNQVKLTEEAKGPVATKFIFGELKLNASETSKGRG